MVDTSEREPCSTAGEAKVERKASQVRNEEVSPGLVASVIEEVKDISAAIGEATAGAKDKVEELASTAVEKVGEAKDKVQEWASTATCEAERAAKGAGHELTTLVRRYPVPALLVAFGLGVFLAQVTRRIVAGKSTAASPPSVGAGCGKAQVSEDV